MKKFLSFSVVILLMLSSCTKEELVEITPEAQLKSYSSGTNNGYFWSLWKSDGLSGSVNYSNGSGGNYSVSWDCSGNFTCGKGWSSGSKTRIVGYNCGSYSHNGGGGSFGYYGWTRNPLTEYYVQERWPGSRPSGNEVGSLSSDGATYDIRTKWVSNAPSIDGTASFRQTLSTRRSQASTGSNHTITFANHANAWSNAGYGLGSDMSPSAILLTESWGTSSGYVNATVWSNGSSSGSSSSSSSGYYFIQNRNTGMRIDGYGRTSNGANCAQYNGTTHANAQWKLVDAGSGYYFIQNRNTGMRIDGYGRTSNGDNCAQYNGTTHANAQWKLVDAN